MNNDPIEMMVSHARSGSMLQDTFDRILVQSGLHMQSPRQRHNLEVFFFCGVATYYNLELMLAPIMRQEEFTALMQNLVNEVEARKRELIEANKELRKHEPGI